MSKSNAASNVVPFNSTSDTDPELQALIDKYHAEKRAKSDPLVAQLKVRIEELETTLAERDAQTEASPKFLKNAKMETYIIYALQKAPGSRLGIGELHTKILHLGWHGSREMFYNALAQKLGRMVMDDVLRHAGRGVYALL
jgi:hypothetical protein